MRAKLIKNVRRWKGKPWIDSGAHFDKGTNCLCFLIKEITDLNLVDISKDKTINRLIHMAKPPSHDILWEHLIRYLNPINIKDIIPGDFVLFLDRKINVNHFGIITEPGTILHASLPDKKVVEHSLRRTDSPYRALRIPEID
jgi:hypothetical protein